MGEIIKDITLNAIKTATLGTVKGVVAVSYWPCLFICMGGTLFYLAGMKKGGKVATGSMLVYVILQAIKLGLM